MSRLVGKVRTVLGDIDAASLGVCYAHEHIVIDHSFATANNSDFLLNDVEKITAELSAFYQAGGRAMVDTMPTECGRNVRLLAEVSRGSAVHILCPTGLHLAKYYEPAHWSIALSPDSRTIDMLVERFVREIEEGIEGTPHRAGVIKVAGSRDRLTDRERAIFMAAAQAQVRTGCPIITHTEEGTAALEQVQILSEHGADLAKVVLSHLDRKPDVEYHRSILSSGAKIEYDSAFRWKTELNPTLELVVALFDEFPSQMMLGMDAARSSYWSSYGGRPGLTFLLGSFCDSMRQRGFGPSAIQRIFVDNPAETYAFAAR